MNNINPAHYCVPIRSYGPKDPPRHPVRVTSFKAAKKLIGEIDFDDRPESLGDKKYLLELMDAGSPVAGSIPHISEVSPTNGLGWLGAKAIVDGQEGQPAPCSYCGTWLLVGDSCPICGTDVVDPGYVRGRGLR